MTTLPRNLIGSVQPIVAPSVRSTVIGGVPSCVELTVPVRDDLVRQVVDGFDGMEKAFALVPTYGQRWRRVPLKYDGTDRNFQVGPDGPSFLPPVDKHRASVYVTRAELEYIAEKGVAFGLDTNQGTVWLQNATDNWGIQGLSLLNGIKNAQGKPVYPNLPPTKIGW